MIHERAPLRVCQETIYRYIYSKEGMTQELWLSLPEHRKSAVFAGPMKVYTVSFILLLNDTV
jgi:IS30 family transposase